MSDKALLDQLDVLNSHLNLPGTKVIVIFCTLKLEPFNGFHAPYTSFHSHITEIVGNKIFIPIEISITNFQQEKLHRVSILYLLSL